jgi:transcriptional regulator with XRE-family HTH domain
MIGTARDRTPRRAFVVSETPSFFAHRLAELREDAGLSQGHLAKLAGLTRQSLSLLEAGKREPAWDTVQKLALALGVDCTEFTDPEMQLPDVKPPGKAGRPRKAPPEEPPAGQGGGKPEGKGRRKGKG